MGSYKRISRRQKMINLMYLVFIVMLALKISTEVLDGFDLINDNIQTTIINTSQRNDKLYEELEVAFNRNPQKTAKWHDLAQLLKFQSDSLYNYIESLKLEIAMRSDGKNADMYNLQAKDDIDAASEIFLDPVRGKGKILKSAIDTYRSNILSQLASSDKRYIIEAGLLTEPSERAKRQKKDWVHASFENMPSIAVITYLAQLQLNLRQAEAEVLHSFLQNIDFTDIRVNELTAYIIPESKTVIKGSNYNANIIIAAVDTTQPPKIVVNNKELAGRSLQIPTDVAGTFPLNGYIEVLSNDGQLYKRAFSDSYNVIDPMAIIEPKLMDVVYAGINNHMIISVPGFTTAEVLATATRGGSLSKDGDLWIAKPISVGEKFTINVSVKTSVGIRLVAQKDFRIRQLPDPEAYLTYTDTKGVKIIKQGGVSRNALLKAGSLKAAIDDGILNTPFSVISFRTFVIDAIGNAMQEMSSGSNFSSRQLEQLKRIDRGSIFFISGILVKGPDGIERQIAPMELRIN